MANSRWTEDETKLALFLYFQTPFGLIHSGNPEIQKLADHLGRTHSSVAMKLANFASLDPKIIQSGRKGLQGASQLDRRVWAEFNNNWTDAIAESCALLGQSDDANFEGGVKEAAAPFSYAPFEGPSTVPALIAQRIGQGFFRRAVLANFAGCCCVTGIAEPALLNASHIKPWALDVPNRHNPANGFAFSATLDRAFDRGLITVDLSYRVRVSSYLAHDVSAETGRHFEKYEGREIRPAVRFDPDPAFIAWHNQERYIDAI